MKKKIIAITAVVMTLIFAVVGTLAYLTATDKEVNTFTVGNVKIKLLESQYHRVNAGVTNKTVAEEPLQGGYLWAGGVDEHLGTTGCPNYATSGETWAKKYFSDEFIENDAAHYKDDGGYFKTHNLMLPGQNCRKNPYVKNIGNQDAYIRVRVLVPVAQFDIIDNGPTYWTSTAMNEGEVVSTAVTTYNNEGYDHVKTVERDGIQYYEYDFTYVDPVKPGEVTFWNVWGNVAINKNATGVKPFKVIFEADAIQATGFVSYVDAFAAFDAQTTNP